VRYVRSLVFTTYLMASACVFGLVMACCFFLPYRFHFAIGRTWARWLLRVLKLLCGLDYTVEGRENIPAGNHIAMCNHTSTWETVAAFVLLPPQVWVIKHELLWVPLVGWGLKLLKPIAIDRGSGRRAVNQVIEQGKARLGDGLWVIIFPEGTRVVAGQQRKYGVSGALLATETGKLIVPISHNAGAFWPRRGLLKKPGTVRVVIGKPIDPAGKDPRALNDEIRAAIEAGVARSERRDVAMPAGAESGSIRRA